MPGLGNQSEIIKLIAVQFGKLIGNYISPLGGVFKWVIAGEDITLGQGVVSSTAGAENTVYRSPVNADMVIGVAYESANVGDLFRIVYSGPVLVLPEAAVTATKGYIIISSNSEIGRSDQSAAVPAAAEHFTEWGHYLATGTGAGVATLAMVHFN